MSIQELLVEKGVNLECLSHGEYRRLLVGSEIYRQQQWMIENQRSSIENRIVSVTQPHVRPMVRGKAGANTEFGTKLSVSCCDGYAGSRANELGEL